VSADATAGVDAGCRLLDWDSEFFGRRIANVDASSIARAGIEPVDDWCRQHRVDCAYLLVDAGDQSVIAAAESSRFRLVDIRVTLAGDIDVRRAAADGVRTAAPADVPRLKAIARGNHRDTRFYMDGHFDRARCDELYAVWIEKSCNGWADHVVVADGAEGAIGYVTCHARGREGQIGLVGVDPAHRERGSGHAMIAAALEWFRGRGLAGVSVATQGRNVAGIRLYQSMGLTIRSIELWFHRWSGETR
jgi:dTDP-4-amino-4,6-dideoxy-D-galactose acyltransferase